MVSAIGSVTDYSAMSSLNFIQGTDSTNSADDTFIDMLSDIEEDDSDTTDTDNKAKEKSDLYKYIKDAMGMPAGLSVEGFDYTQSSDSAPQAASGSSDSTGSSNNEMDLNNDGVVTADEIMQYMQNQQKNKLSETIQNSLNKYASENITGGLNTINAANAYNGSVLSSLSGSAMTLNIAI